MKDRKIGDFPIRYNYERKMIADILRLGKRYPNLWMNFELEVSALAALQKDTSKNRNFPGFTTCFFMAYAQVLKRNPGFMAQVKGHKIIPPEDVRVRVSSRNVIGRTVSVVVANPEEMNAMEVQRLFKKLLLRRDALLSPLQQTFFQLPWLMRYCFYWYWMRSAQYRGEVFGYAYFASNGNANLSGTFTAHTPGPGAIGAYFSNVVQREGRYWVTMSITADHRILDAYHLTKLAEEMEQALNQMAHAGFNH